jgi:hypothetical protein
MKTGTEGLKSVADAVMHCKEQVKLRKTMVILLSLD